MAYYDVIPLGATRRDLFTYRGDRDVPMGQVVTIPLGRARTTGVVVGPAAAVPRAKEITSVSPRRLPPQTVALIRWAAETYRAPAGTAARLSLPTWLGRAAAVSSAATTRRDNRPPTRRIIVSSHRIKRYRELLAGATRFLLLIPEIALAESLAELERTTGAVRFHSGLTAAQRTAIWDGVGTGQITRLIGTRAALWLPWLALDQVVVDEEDDRSYKSDRAPRYHGRSVATKLAALHSAEITLASAAPSLEAWSHAITHGWQTELSSGGFPEIVTTGDGPAAGPLSPLAMESLEAGRTLIWAPERLRPRIATYLRRQRPGLAVSTLAGHYGTRAAITRFARQPDAVLLGGVALTHSWNFAADRVIVAGIDGLLQLPDFRAAERAHGILRKLAGHVPDGSLVIQTEHADHPAIGRLGRDLAPFYQAELTERQLLKLPPVTRLSRLTFRQPGSRSLAQATEIVTRCGLTARPIESATPTLLITGDPLRLPQPLPADWVLDVDTQTSA